MDQHRLVSGSHGHPLTINRDLYRLQDGFQHADMIINIALIKP